MLRKFLCLLAVVITAVLVSPPCADAQSATLTTVYSFPADVGTPSALIQASDGNFYGTTPGVYGSVPATIFKLTPSGTFSTLYTFPSGAPLGSLIEAGDGNLYGTTGTAVFKITLAGVITFFTVPGQTALPAGLIQGSDGNFYGVTEDGGLTNEHCQGNDADGTCGTIIKMTPSGTFTTLYQFCSTLNTSGYCLDGQTPLAGLVQANDGNFYGTTSLGGLFGTYFGSPCSGYDFASPPCGTGFKISPSGSFTSIYDFCLYNQYCVDGNLPATTLVQGSNLALSGTTVYGGENADGSIFGINGNTAYDFNTQAEGNAVPNNGFPGSDGGVYGTTAFDGEYTPGCGVGNGCGWIYEVPTSGFTASVYSFDGNGTDPNHPGAGLVQASDGTFFGTTYAGGASGFGAIYQATHSPALAAPVQLSLSSSSGDINQPVTLTWDVLNATAVTMQQCYGFVQNNASGAGTWTGLQVGTTTNDVYSGSATITPTAEGFYTYALTCGGVESGFVNLSVAGSKPPTTTTLTANTPVVLGGVVMLAAAVTSNQSSPAATGSVTFSYGTLSLGTVQLSGIQTADLSVTAQGIPTGTYNITASYSGDANYLASSGSASITVLGYATSTTLTASSTKVTQGQSTTLSATVARTSKSGTPSGSVSFYYGATYLGKGTLSGGIATYTAATNGSIPSGTYAVTAKYSGDSSDQASTSAAVNVTVIAATTTSLSVTPDPVPANHAVAIAAQVKQTYGHTIPTGTITFDVGSYYIGEQTLDDSGSVALNLSSTGFSAGTYPLTANYSGDANNAASSKTVQVMIQ